MSTFDSLAGLALEVEGYVGHSWGVQFLALISVSALAASVARPTLG